MHDYFSARETGQFAFFRIPMALIKNEEYKSVSIDAKLLYGLLLDRMSLSEHNGWRDVQGRVFIFYTIKAVCEDLGCCRGKVCRLLDELEKADLIERKRLGQGKHSRIYVKRFASEVRETDFCNFEKQTSESSENSIPEVGKADANHIEKNQIELSYTDLSSCARTEDEIREQLEYPILSDYTNGRTDTVDAIISVIAEAERSTAKTLRVGGTDLPREAVVAVLRELDFTHVEYVLDCLEESRPGIRNIRAYLLTALYHAPDTIDAYYAAKVAHDGG